MKHDAEGDTTEKRIDLLNRAVAYQLTAVHQYLYFHFHCHHQGYHLLAGLFRRTAIEEMLHIERIAERILFMKGDLKLAAAEPVLEVKDTTAMLQRARSMEEQCIRDYSRWAEASGAAADAVSQRLFQSLLADEERHYDQFDWSSF
jgi:bacterioferritin